MRTKTPSPLQRPAALAVQTKPQYLSFRPALTSFRSKHNSHHDPSLNHLIWHTDWSGHIFHDRTVRRISERPRDCLWWTVSASLKVSSKAVVRKHAIRRLSNVFVGVLRSNGFDHEGRLLKEDGGNQELAGGLRGSLRMELTPTALTADKSVLETEVKTLVERLKPCF